MSGICSECGKEPRFYQKFKRCPMESKNCLGKLFCFQCLDNCCSLESDPSKIISMCKKNFIDNVGIDMDVNVQHIGQQKGTAPSLLFVHGGGANRLMFAHHARLLASKFCCVLVDLPGHGSRMDDPLTLNTAIAAIMKATDDHTAPFKSTRPIYIGGSLGGYIGMEILGKYPSTFQSAVILMAGQNVGIGRSWKAYLGLLAFKTLIPLLATRTMMNGLLSQAKKNPFLKKEILEETVLRTGMYFNQGLAQVDILYNSDPAAALGRFEGRVLFINGSKDHRDSELRWVDCCKHGNSSGNLHDKFYDINIQFKHMSAPKSSLSRRIENLKQRKDLKARQSGIILLSSFTSATPTSIPPDLSLETERLLCRIPIKKVTAYMQQTPSIPRLRLKEKPEIKCFGIGKQFDISKTQQSSQYEEQLEISVMIAARSWKKPARFAARSATKSVVEAKHQNVNSIASTSFTKSNERFFDEDLDQQFNILDIESRQNEMIYNERIKILPEAFNYTEVERAETPWKWE